MSRVFVVVVTFNGEPWIRSALNSLRRSSIPVNTIVVDNGSTDKTVEIVDTEFPEVDLIVCPRNAGFGVGNNIGIARALRDGSDYVFLLNQDAYALETTLAELVHALDLNPCFGAASPLHCSPDSEHLDLKSYRGYLRTYGTEYLSEAALGRASNLYQIFGINAAAWLVRASTFRTVGGFDPIFFMYGEDDDMLARFAHHGVRFALIPSARVVHLRETAFPKQCSVLQTLAADARRIRSALIAQVKRPEFGLFHMMTVWMAAGLLRPLADVLVDRKLGNYVASFLAAIRVLVEMPNVYRRARLCSRPGAHFIEMS